MLTITTRQFWLSQQLLMASCSDRTWFRNEKTDSPSEQTPISLNRIEPADSQRCTTLLNMMQHFVRCFPWHSCQWQLQLRPQKHNTHTHINTDTQSRGLKHFQSLTRVIAHQLLPQSPSSSYQKPLKWLGLSDGGLKQLSAFRAEHRLCLSLRSSRAHVVTILKGNADPLGKACVCKCVCVCCW